MPPKFNASGSSSEKDEDNEKKKKAEPKAKGRPRKSKGETKDSEKEVSKNKKSKSDDEDEGTGATGEDTTKTPKKRPAADEKALAFLGLDFRRSIAASRFPGLASYVVVRPRQVRKRRLL